MTPAVPNNLATKEGREHKKRQLMLAKKSRVGHATAGILERKLTRICRLRPDGKPILDPLHVQRNAFNACRSFMSGVMQRTISAEML